jgi:hypothetical protein
MGRPLDVDGARWTVSLTGRVTPYDADEFALVFEHGTGPDRLRRVARFSPVGSRRRAAALAELSDAQLLALFRVSQPAATSPEMRYRRAEA